MSHEHGIELPQTKDVPMTEYVGDVWLRFENPGDEEPIREANTFKVEGGFEIQWCLVDVGVVTTVAVPTLEAAHDWYKRNGYDDYSA